MTTEREMRRPPINDEIGDYADRNLLVIAAAPDRTVLGHMTLEAALALRIPDSPSRDLILVADDEENPVVRLGDVVDYTKEIPIRWPVPEGYRVFYPTCIAWKRNPDADNDVEVVKIIRCAVLYRVEGVEISLACAWASPKDTFNRFDGRHEADEHLAIKPTVFSLSLAPNLKRSVLQECIASLLPALELTGRPSSFERYDHVTYCCS